MAAKRLQKCAKARTTSPYCVATGTLLISSSFLVVFPMSKTPNFPPSVWSIFASLILSLLASQRVVANDEEPPRELTQAREIYEDEFFRNLEAIQQKYKRALEQYVRNYTRSGKLDAAQEASKEAGLVEKWETIPDKIGARSMKDPELNSLLNSYENACKNVIDPITEKYIQTLDRLKSNFTQAGNLEASVHVDAELKRTKQGIGLPAKKGGVRYLSKLSREEFGEWLEEQTFEFVGKVAGSTKLKFKDGKVDYGPEKIYDYKVTGNRTVKIEKGGGAAGFVLEFSTDLQSGTFISNRGKYPLKINGKAPKREE